MLWMFKACKRTLLEQLLNVSVTYYSLHNESNTKLDHNFQCRWVSYDVIMHIMFPYISY